ncbi:hypothetical protein ACFV7Q_36625 [Streptomyces sp. NPDC059851]|uniref:hypothetical protein n=1 Tax=Streptomyces sp. NPDC059851 TaxID=3346971 RepID=UPI00364A0AC3
MQVSRPSARADAGVTDLAHAALAARDGWAASGSGTTGGQAADAAHDVTVTTRAELVKALRAGPSGAPRVIRVKGRIDANTDDRGRPLGCADYAKSRGHALSAYLKAYDPAVWGRSKLPAGAQESARAAAQAKQAERVVITAPSNRRTPPSSACPVPTRASTAVASWCRRRTTSSSAT